MNPDRIKPVDSPYNLNELLYINYFEQKFVDTTIRASNGTIKAHALVLNGNPVFKKLLVSGNVINLPQFSKEVLRVIIEFLYRGDSRYYNEIEKEVLKAKNYFFRLQTPTLVTNSNIEESVLLDESQIVPKTETEIWATAETQIGHNVVTSTQMPDEPPSETVCFTQETSAPVTIRPKKRNRENSKTDSNEEPGTSKDLPLKQPADIIREQLENALPESSDGSFVFDLPHEQLTSSAKDLRVNIESVGLNMFELTDDELSGEILPSSNVEIIISSDSEDEVIASMPKRMKTCKMEPLEKEDVCVSVIPQKVPEPNPGKGTSVPKPNPGKGTSVSKPNPGKGTSVSEPNPGERISVVERMPGNGTSVPKPNPGKGTSVSERNPGETTSVEERIPGKGTSVPKPNPGKGTSVSERNPGESTSVEERIPGKGTSVSGRNPGESTSVEERIPGTGTSVSGQNPGETTSVAERIPGKGTSVPKPNPGKGTNVPEGNPGESTSVEGRIPGKKTSVTERIPENGASVPKPNPGKGTSVSEPNESEPNPEEMTSAPEPIPRTGTMVPEPDPGEGTSVPEPNPEEGTSACTFSDAETNVEDGETCVEDIEQWLQKDGVRNGARKKRGSRLISKTLKENANIRVEDVEQWLQKDGVSEVALNEQESSITSKTLKENGYIGVADTEQWLQKEGVSDGARNEIESRIISKTVKENANMCVVCMKELSTDCINKTHNMSFKKKPETRCRKCNHLFYSKFFLKEHEKICGT